MNKRRRWKAKRKRALRRWAANLKPGVNGNLASRIRLFNLLHRYQAPAPAWY